LLWAQCPNLELPAEKNTVHVKPPKKTPENPQIIPHQNPQIIPHQNPQIIPHQNPQIIPHLKTPLIRK
jgi:hypothetical protein